MGEVKAACAQARLRQNHTGWIVIANRELKQASLLTRMREILENGVTCYTLLLCIRLCAQSKCVFMDTLIWRSMIYGHIAFSNSHSPPSSIIHSTHHSSLIAHRLSCLLCMYMYMCDMYGWRRWMAVQRPATGLTTATTALEQHKQPRHARPHPPHHHHPHHPYHPDHDHPNSSHSSITCRNDKVSVCSYCLFLFSSSFPCVASSPHPFMPTLPRSFMLI